VCMYFCVSMCVCIFVCQCVYVFLCVNVRFVCQCQVIMLVLMSVCGSGIYYCDGRVYYLVLVVFTMDVCSGGRIKKSVAQLRTQKRAARAQSLLLNPQTHRCVRLCVCVFSVCV
jgi:hypothetical protein